MVDKKIPIGIEDFEEIRKENFYYIDKTGLIQELLKGWGKVNLFTRPRRFGKTLNMSMLKCFFETGTDKELFEGLQISEEKELCRNYMGKYPVIFISLKSTDGQTFEEAKAMLGKTVNREALRLQYLAESDRLSEYDKAPFIKMLKNEMDAADLKSSLWELSRLLSKHYGKKVILLIDEYDVPLDKAYDNGYYGEMISLLRSFLEQALKTNEFLQFAVLTGCLRISKESVFTGLNNFVVNTISDPAYDEYFGFTDGEVQKLLEDYGMENVRETVKEWYDGYRFGQNDVYCPWDVLCYARDLLHDSSAFPELYWINTSSNHLIRRFIGRADKSTQREIERLIEGGEIVKELKGELTYNEIDKSIENLWSVLYTTGYLSGRKIEGMKYRLSIPNREVREIFETQIQEWFREEIVKKDSAGAMIFCCALQNGDCGKAEQLFNGYLRKTISIRDTFVRKNRKENFYHGILLGILSVRDDWIMHSNIESGEGFADIVVETESETGFVIEVKYAENDRLEIACEKALKQIEENSYPEELKEAGLTEIYVYAVACYKKHCKIECRKIL